MKFDMKKSVPKIKRKPIPKKVNIGFRTYDIKESSEKGEPTYHGITIFNRNTIELSSICGDDEIKATLFHEFFHAFLYDNGISSELSSKKEEMWCQAFSQAIMLLVRDPVNWKILEWARNKEEVHNLPEFKVDDIS